MGKETDKRIAKAALGACLVLIPAGIFIETHTSGLLNLGLGALSCVAGGILLLQFYRGESDAN